jgi:hypothetical protein
LLASSAAVIFGLLLLRESVAESAIAERQMRRLRLIRFCALLGVICATLSAAQFLARAPLGALYDLLLNPSAILALFITFSGIILILLLFPRVGGSTEKD